MMTMMMTMMTMMNISFAKYPSADKIHFNFWVVASDLNFLAFAFEILLMLVLVVDQLLKWKYFWIFLGNIFGNIFEILLMLVIVLVDQLLKWKYFLWKRLDRAV